MRGFATGVGSKADIGAADADPTSSFGVHDLGAGPEAQSGTGGGVSFGVPGSAAR